MKRTGEILKLTGKVLLLETLHLTKKLASRGQEEATRILQANEIVKTLQELKGASLKFGQLLSIDVSGYLPPEAQVILSQLQKDVPPMELAELLNELPKLKEIDIHHKAIAAASIGQVHDCKWENKSAVIKIQYPKMEESIQADLKILSFIMDKLKHLYPAKIDIKIIIKELEESLLDECNYELEMNKMKIYKKNMDSQHFYVPEVYAADKRYLVMEKITGPSLSEWLLLNPSNEDKKIVADRLIKLFFKEFFEFGFVQTDPNPANFIIMQDLKIALLDAGAIRKYDLSFINIYRELLITSYRNEQQKMLDAAYKMNLISESESINAKNEFIRLMTYLISPFKDSSFYPLKDNTYHQVVVKLSLDYSKELKEAKIPKEIILLHRKLGGIFSLLQKIHPEINFTHYWAELIKT